MATLCCCDDRSQPADECAVDSVGRFHHFFFYILSIFNESADLFARCTTAVFVIIFCWLGDLFLPRLALYRFQLLLYIIDTSDANTKVPGSCEKGSRIKKKIFRSEILKNERNKEFTGYLLCIETTRALAVDIFISI